MRKPPVLAFATGILTVASGVASLAGAQLQGPTEVVYVPAVVRSGVAPPPPTPTPQPPTPTPVVSSRDTPYPTPEAALAAEAARKGYEYIGECGNEYRPDAVGKMCHNLFEHDGRTRVYSLGWYGTDAGSILTLELRESGWVITKEEWIVWENPAGWP